MNANQSTKSTSSVMSILFGDHINVIRNKYKSTIDNLITDHLYIAPYLHDCDQRTAFYWPYFAVEYGYFSIRGKFLPPSLKDFALAYGLSSLAVAVDDDVVDETWRSPVWRMNMLCTSTVIRHGLYNLLASHKATKERLLTLMAIKQFTRTVTEYQVIDVIFIHENCPVGFNYDQYLETTYKTGCIFDFGFRLGVKLADERITISDNILRFTKLMGNVLQLIDDILDLPDDLTHYKDYSITFPMEAYKRNGNLEDCYHLAATVLDKAETIAKEAFPKPAIVLRLIANFHKVLTTIKN